MASGQVFGLSPNPPGRKFAYLDFITGTGTATGSAEEQVPVWAFDAATGEFLDFYGRTDNYASGGLTLVFGWGAATATAGAAVLRAAIRAIPSDAEQLTVTQHAYDFNGVTATGPNLTGEVVYSTITFTSGADMDSLANNEAFILRVNRNATATGDDMSGLTYLHDGAITLKET